MVVLSLYAPLPNAMAIEMESAICIVVKIGLERHQRQMSDLPRAESVLLLFRVDEEKDR